jgi:HEAT repeat protein
MLQGRTSESATVVPALIDAMQDKNLYVRRDAARALADFGPEAKAAVEPLIARLKDEEPSVRKAAAASLKQIDPAAAKKAGVP